MWSLCLLCVFVVAAVVHSADPPPPNNPGCASSGFNSVSIRNSSSVCIPISCDYDGCVPELGTCTSYGHSGNQCHFSSGNYTGIQSFPFAVSTEYCSLSASGGCNGGACGDKITPAFLSGYGVTGVAAVNAIIFGLDQQRSNSWGQACTHNSKTCYWISGPGGSANVMITDRCAGYCKFNSNTGKCDPNGNLDLDCGVCVQTTQNPANIRPNCPCIGTDGELYPTCCGNDKSCGSPLVGTCDWCAGNNHAHFDLDIGTFNHVCGSKATIGHCVLNRILPFHCG